MITHLLLLTRWEWFKLRRRWMPWILLVILIALPQIGVVSSYFIFRGDINAGFEISASYTYTTESESGGQQTTIELTCADFEDGSIPPQIAELPPQMQDSVLNDSSDLQEFCLGQDSEDLVQSESRRFFAIPGSIANGLSISVGMAIILIIVLTSSSIGSEYSWGTLRTSLTRGTGRWQFLTSKILLLIFAGAGGLIISSLALLASSLILTALLPSSVGEFSDAGDWSTAFVVFGKLVFVLAPYIMLAAFFTVLTSSTGVGVSLTMGYYVVEGIVVGILGSVFDWFHNVANFILGPNVAAWMIENGTEVFTFGPQGENAPGTLHSFFVLLGYILVLGAVSLWLFQRRDVAGAKGD